MKCEYCSGNGKHEMLIDENALVVWIEDGFISAEGREYDGGFQYGDIRIKYCPICGRRLVE